MPTRYDPVAAARRFLDEPGSGDPAADLERACDLLAALCDQVEGVRGALTYAHALAGDLPMGASDELLAVLANAIEDAEGGAADDTQRPADRAGG